MANRRVAVIIGVNHAGADPSLPSLRYAQRDAEAVAQVLTDPRTGSFDTSDVRLFVGPQVRADEVKAALRRIVLDSDESDVFLLYFAGHTLVPSWSRGTDLYLVTPDLDESVLSESPDAGLRREFLTRDVLQHFKGTAVLVLDCCQAGGVVTFRDVDLVGFGGRDNPRHGVLAACAGKEYAREDPALRHGVFTHHLLEGMLGGAANAHGVVTFETLSAYVCEQGLDPRPSVSLQARETTWLTRPGAATGEVDRRITVPAPSDAVQITTLANPLDQHVAELVRLIDRLARKAQPPSSVDGATGGSSRVEYVRSALEADAVAYLSHTIGAGSRQSAFAVIDATGGFDLESSRHLLQATAGDAHLPLNRRGFGCIASDARQDLWCAPLGRSADHEQILAITNPPAWLVGLGQAGAKVLQAIWNTDFAGSPEEAEVQVLTALRGAFGRLPDMLFQRCFHLYGELLKTLRIVFQPVITIGRSPLQVGVHSYEALARRSLTDQSAPYSLLQLAHTWGDHFVVARDQIILEKALTAYALAHADAPWSDDVPKPLSINVSVRSLLDDSYIETLRQFISGLQLHPNAITLEISEQDAIEPWAGEQWREAPHTFFNKRLAAIARGVGVAFALDDFGTGHASLSRMAELPLTHIKVDRAILHHRQAMEELQLVVAVSRDAVDRGETHTARPVIVEGVDHESPITLHQIYSVGINHVQGYITGERGATELRHLPTDIRKDIAARVRGDDGNRPTGITRGDRPAGGTSVRRSA